jgi:hypothetical protein
MRLVLGGVLLYGVGHLLHGVAELLARLGRLLRRVLHDQLVRDMVADGAFGRGRLQVGVQEVLVDLLHPPGLLVVPVQLDQVLHSPAKASDSVFLFTEKDSLYAGRDLRRVVVEDAGETVPAVLAEEDRADEEQDGEAHGHRGVLYGEHTQRYDLCQDQREHRGVVHDGPQLPSHLILRVVHIQDLHISFCFEEIKG